MIAHHTLLENCTSLFSCSYMELLSFKCRENQLLSQALGSCAGTQVKLQMKDWDAGILCPLRLPWDYRKGHLSHIVPSTPSSSWPGMQHMLQDYCKTCPASYPFSSSLALVSTAWSCVRPGVSFPLAIPGHAEGSSLWRTSVLETQGNAGCSTAPHKQAGEAGGPSFCQQHQCPVGTAAVLCVGKMPDLCQTDIQLTKA